MSMLIVYSLNSASSRQTSEWHHQARDALDIFDRNYFRVRCGVGVSLGPKSGRHTVAAFDAGDAMRDPHPFGCCVVERRIYCRPQRVKVSAAVDLNDCTRAQGRTIAPSLMRVGRCQLEGRVEQVWHCFTRRPRDQPNTPGRRARTERRQSASRVDVGHGPQHGAGPARNAALCQAVRQLVHQRSR